MIEIVYVALTPKYKISMRAGLLPDGVVVEGIVVVTSLVVVFAVVVVVFGVVGDEPMFETYNNINK